MAAAVASQRTAALRRERSSSTSSLRKQEYSFWGMDDELCSVCARPVDTPGSLYCSADCMREDERLTATSSKNTLPSSSTAAAAPKYMIPSSSDSALSTSASRPSASGLDSLRYNALPSPMLGATVISSSDRSRSQHTHTLSLGSSSIGKHMSQSSNGYSARVGRWPNRRASAAPRAHVQSASGLVAPHGEEMLRRTSGSSSNRSSSPSDPDSCDPTTPSPQMWATSAPHAHMHGEPSALKLPPSMESEAHSLSSTVKRSPSMKPGSGGTVIGSLPSPTTVNGMLRYTRRASHTAQPAPVLFTSPIIQATRMNASATGDKRSKSKSTTPAMPPADVSAKAGSGSDTSDLDLRDNESTGGSSGFSLDRSNREPASPRSRSSAVLSPEAPQPQRAGQHQRNGSDTVLFSSSRRSIASPFLHATTARPSVAHASTAPPAQAVFSTSHAASIPANVPEEAEESVADAPAPASPPVVTAAPAPDAARESGRGRSHARGTRSSSRRRSPSPPRRGDRRMSSRGRLSMDGEPTSGTSPTLPSVPLLDDDEEDLLRAPSSPDADERPRGRQGQRGSAATGLLRRAAGSLTRYTICEQAFPGYGHDDL